MRRTLCLLVSSLLIIISCETVPSQGEQLYAYYCSNCHMPDGSGLAQLIPPINSSDYLNQHWNDLACIIKYGQHEEIMVNDIVYSEPMPGAPQLTDTEIINIISYIHENWHDDKKMHTPAQIRSFLTECDVP